MTQAFYGDPKGKIEVRWTGSTYDYNLEIRTMTDYGANQKITYRLTKLW